MILKSTRADAIDGTRQRGGWEKAVGLKEELLCAACEGRFSKYESYARGLFYGSAPPPLRKQPLGTLIPGFSVSGGPLIGARMVDHLDYRLLRLFQLSLLWRASVAKGTFFENVSLGSKHEAIVTGMLRAENPGKESDYCCVMMDLRHNGNTCEDFIEQPFSGREDSHRTVKMIIGGFQYLFYVSSHIPPPEPLGACVKPSGKMLLLVADAGVILQRWANDLGKAGKL